MEVLKKVLQESKENKWPYPKTFEAIKNAGVTSYTVHFEGYYSSTYTGSFGSYEEKGMEGYQPLTASKSFSQEGLRQAVIDHAVKQSHYLDFLKDATDSGATHYVVDMDKRTVTYYNLDESASYQEHVPQMA
ncbi:DUF1398 family protein [Estrella lausannensis]|uniref:DUF1398 domain-containing protein n=1 Tax=Estrella lausannensis TaxID=483423 RepID=A0A0H5DQX2_9BACT|nr:DUF1398 family protein [Estrella lausannensis]CRX38009.1 hypothetical protein ELAC_0657 [Estrella lausannensis]